MFWAKLGLPFLEQGGTYYSYFEYWKGLLRYEPKNVSHHTKLNTLLQFRPAKILVHTVCFSIDNWKYDFLVKKSDYMNCTNHGKSFPVRTGRYSVQKHSTNALCSTSQECFQSTTVQKVRFIRVLILIAESDLMEFESKGFQKQVNSHLIHSCAVCITF